MVGKKQINGKRYELDLNNRILSKIGAVLESTDRRTIPFLDVLIENELKKVISNSAVQQYVGKIHQYFIMSTQEKNYSRTLVLYIISNLLFVGDLWEGGLRTWPTYKLYLFYIAIILVPPVWIIFSLPLDNKYNKTPIVRYIVNITSHIYFMIIQIAVACLPIYPLARDSMLPYWIEWLLFLWLCGDILVQFTEKQEKRGFIKVLKNLY